MSPVDGFASAVFSIQEICAPCAALLRCDNAGRCPKTMGPPKKYIYIYICDINEYDIYSYIYIYIYMNIYIYIYEYIYIY